ncbi:DUF3953 domain-containing protein [Bacillus dakarensis]|uniref:DUF3953 domain-containing protein n=1 Tax=Robertmurraya dakarensis TaxID=1926278 RepID=UPI0009819519|nr:DUF3953 domain-containing protein [Bacillus dakarensis]
MIKILQITFSIIALMFLIYEMFSRNFAVQPLVIFFLGLALLMMGIRELQQERKITGGLLIVVFLLSLFVSIKSVLLN